MTEFISKRKKPCVIGGIVVTVVVLFIYLRAIFLLGLWHGDAFFV